MALWSGNQTDSHYADVAKHGGTLMKNGQGFGGARVRVYGWSPPIDK